MKKSILNLGKALNKAEQKNVNGGNSTCVSHSYRRCFGQCRTMPQKYLSLCVNGCKNAFGC